MSHQVDHVEDTEPYRTNIALCRALGLDPYLVKRVTIDINGDGYPVVSVEMRMKAALADEWAAAVDTKYKLVPIEGDAE
jgi:hypothetical protein